MKKIIQVLGPTGVGKSEVAILLAKKIGGEIISADSMQVYKDFDIGTAKLSKQDMKNIPHHLIDILSDCSQYNAARFSEMSFEIAIQIKKRGHIPIVCGGTALYLKIMISGVFPELKKKRIPRTHLNNLGESRGGEFLWKQLNEVDPEYAKKISVNDRLRLVRALDIYYNQGLPPSEIFKKTVSLFKQFQFIRVGLNMERDKLYEKINHRVDHMMGSGFIEEVKKLRKKYPLDCPPFSSLGYKEISQLLDGVINSTEALRLIRQHTRNFAKRQLSWFRREKDIIWFHPDNVEQIILFVEEKFQNKSD
ncbi:MAG: tRNA (adenosine(37)-N6)-dimethylallyltransferase MiaA [Candidatus Aminicenantes bacterium]|nr:tRNA (adenosine(37)-N6)-dimethylallyltransferase MiaA [Candidatus Aminicenantes bacterium]